MKKNFSVVYKSLNQLAAIFDDTSAALKEEKLGYLTKMQLPLGNLLLLYHDLLLFLCAYPDNAGTKQLAEKELKRIAAHAKKHAAKLPYNEGLPYTYILTRFSPDFLRWLIKHEDIRVEFDSFYEPGLNLNEVLNITLPTLFKAETTAGLTNEELLGQLGVKQEQYIPFLLGQVETLYERPLLKELFNEKLDVYVKLHPKNEKFSKANNRITVNDFYYHSNLLKKFDAGQLISEPLPAAVIPAQTERDELYKCIRNAMALTVREIDPATFLQANTTRLYDVGRGLILSVYSMLPERQLPLETYFGFTFFKNGIPVSYGGVWAFGKLARLGLNIFEPYRSGESGYLLCQLIRVFRQAMGNTYFEIEPYQFGLDNPGGIKSGAFWFYHKFGFRPVDKELKKLAADEYQKITGRKNYRSSEKTLMRFTENNIALNLLNEAPPLDVLVINRKVLAAIKRSWEFNYAAARQNAVDDFCNQTALDAASLNPVQKNTLEELALWAMAYKINQPEKLKLMKEMLFLKTSNDYAYQELLLKFFSL
ncbi:MAG: hypothetical protein WAT19_05260 [Ferruginibacter sp.]